MSVSLSLSLFLWPLLSVYSQLTTHECFAILIGPHSLNLKDLRVYTLCTHVHTIANTEAGASKGIHVVVSATSQIGRVLGSLHMMNIL